MIHHMPAVYLVQAKQLNIQQIIANEIFIIVFFFWDYRLRDKMFELEPLFVHIF